MTENQADKNTTYTNNWMNNSKQNHRFSSGEVYGNLIEPILKQLQRQIVSEKYILNIYN